MRDPGDEMYAIQVRAPYIWRDRSYVMFLRIGLIDFFVDLSPGMSALPELELRVKEIYGGKGVWVLPTRE
jgi:hypothetical protein